MLGVLLPFDDALYAIDARRIVEIVPLVALRPVALLVQALLVRPALH